MPSWLVTTRVSVIRNSNLAMLNVTQQLADLKQEPQQCSVSWNTQ